LEALARRAAASTALSKGAAEASWAGLAVRDVRFLRAAVSDRLSEHLGEPSSVEARRVIRPPPAAASAGRPPRLGDPSFVAAVSDARDSRAAAAWEASMVEVDSTVAADLMEAVTGKQ